MKLVKNFTDGDVYASLPSRECGLKFVKIHCDNFHVRVTPFAGVWIEIGWHSRVDVAARVTPFAGVWIEISSVSMESLNLQVTPFAGVWIEINRITFVNRHGAVTPFAGVWIEIIHCLSS